MAKPGRKSKVKKLGKQAEQLVHQMRGRDKSFQDIANELEDKFNTTVSKHSVMNYWNEHKNERLARMSERNINEIEKEEFKEILDVEDQLEKLNEKLNEALDTLDPEDRQDMGQLRQLSKEIRQQLEQQRKFRQDVLNQKTENNYYDIDNNVTAIEINRHLRELEDQGVIEVKKPEELQI